MDLLNNGHLADLEAPRLPQRIKDSEKMSRRCEVNSYISQEIWYKFI